MKILMMPKILMSKSNKEKMYDYDLELERIVSEIKRLKAKKILIQLAEGLKPRAKEIQEFIESNNPGANISFWLNSCYGKCDIPEFLNSKDADFDMLIQFGH
jgi:diphthamide biosynthesis enzyme Dph1/Dph2-like protein